MFKWKRKAVVVDVKCPCGLKWCGKRNKIRSSGCDCEKKNPEHRSHRYSFRGGALFARIFHFFMEAELEKF